MTASLRRPLRLAYLSPLPPARSGVSDYSRDLLPHLEPWADLHLFADEPASIEPELAWRFPVWPCSHYAWRRAIHGYDCAVYQLGNSPAHRFLYKHLFQHPGVVVLHELVLHHLLVWMGLEADGAGTYLREMTYEHGPAGARVAWRVLTGQQEAPFFESPLCQRALDASLGVIVHSRYMAREVQRLSPSARVRVVPMPMPVPRVDENRAQARRRLGFPEDAFIVGSLGEATAHKRLDVLMAAFARLQESRPNSFLVIAGRQAPGLQLQAAADRLGVGNRFRAPGAVPADDFFSYLNVIDVAVNLRYPTAGETSAAALRSLAAGVVTVVSDVGAGSELPQCCFKLPVGDDEVALLALLLQRVAEDTGIRSRLGQAGRDFVARHHAPQQAAREYVRFIEEVLMAPARIGAGNTGPDRKNGPSPSGLVRDVAGSLREIGVGTQDPLFLRELAGHIAIMDEHETDGAASLPPAARGGEETR